MKIFLAVVVLLISFNSALGCSYIGYPDPPLSYIISKLDTIFIGTVVSKQTTDEKDEYDERVRVRRMKFKVERTLKGVHQEFQEFATYEPLLKTSCSTTPTEFKIGEKWVIHRDFDRGSEKRRNEIGLFFSYYRELKTTKSAEYVAEIENYIKNPVTAVYGQMETRVGSQIFKGVEVFLEGNGIKASTIVDKDGRYKFENIPAGDYRVQIRFPVETFNASDGRKTVFEPATQTFNIEYEATVEMGGSDYYYLVS